MPTYVYETIPADGKSSPRRFEMVQRMTDEPLRVDPETGEPVRRVVTGGIGLMTKGTVDYGGGCSSSGAGGPCGGGVCGLN
ncbi:MAG: zinc ribbon domain-containing protein [Gammaproteobacteria bacterium]